MDSELIEKAAKAIGDASEDGNWFQLDEVLREWCRRDARAVLAVFEAAQKPSGDERARTRIVAELRWLADAREKYQTETFPQIAREVQTARQLADILERETPVAAGGQGFGWIPSWMWDEWDQMAVRRPVPPSPALGDLEEHLGRTSEGTALLPALWALAGVSMEPSAGPFSSRHENGLPEPLTEPTRNPCEFKPQAEPSGIPGQFPTDAQVVVIAKHLAQAALDWVDIEGDAHEHTLECTNWTAYKDDGLAALRAAAETTNENGSAER